MIRIHQIRLRRRIRVTAHDVERQRFDCVGHRQRFVIQILLEDEASRESLLRLIGRRETQVNLVFTVGQQRRDIAESVHDVLALSN